MEGLLMKVFVATRGEYDDFQILGVFSSREAFETFLNESQAAALKAQYPEAVSVSASGYHLNCPPKLHDFECHEFEMDCLPQVAWEHKTQKEMFPGHALPADYPKDFIEASKVEPC